MDLRNRQVGQYRALVRIAQGGYSEIWRSHPLSDKNRPVALKVMKIEFSADKNTRKIFEREWKIARTFDHPNIPRYLDYGVDHNRPFLALEFLDGQTLRNLMKDRKERLQGQIGPIIEGACAALAYLHGQGICHRDVKPENLMLNEEGLVHLIDFANAQTKWRAIFKIGNAVDGTPSYMAPEQLTGKRITPQSDIYALGCVLFELLSGRPPFTGETANDVMNQTLSAPPPRLSRFNRSVSSGIDKLVENMLAKDPAERPHDIGVVLRRFQGTNVYIQS